MRDLALDVVAAHRLTRLVTEDSITDPLRDAVDHRAADADGGPWVWLSTLLSCRWCAGQWIGLGIVFVARRYRWWPPMRDALVISSGAALLAGLEE